jgi:acyl carrier protein phosphodiesterase
MNLLAHAYLSFGDEQVLVGNMISDYVKGKQQFNFPETVQRGIRLHRKIDAFTDEHESTKTLKKLFAQEYRLYAGAIVDVVYDYFLANDTQHFAHSQALHDFTAQTYEQLAKHTQHFPEKFASMFPYMQQQNWLYNYKENWGMQKAFAGLAKRAKYMGSAEGAYQTFLNNLAYIKPYYHAFFKDAYDMVVSELK